MSFSKRAFVKSPVDKLYYVSQFVCQKKKKKTQRDSDQVYTEPSDSNYSFLFPKNKPAGCVHYYISTNQPRKL